MDSKICQPIGCYSNIVLMRIVIVFKIKNTYVYICFVIKNNIYLFQ